MLNAIQDALAPTLAKAPGSATADHDDALKTDQEGGDRCVHYEHKKPEVPYDVTLLQDHATSRPAMSSHRLQMCLLILGWSVRDLARRTDRHQTTVVRWANGHSPVPDDVADWLETLAAFHIAHPGPRFTKTFLSTTI